MERGGIRLSGLARSAPERRWPGVPENPGRLPGSQRAVRELFGKSGGIPGETERLDRQQRGGGVVTVGDARLGGKTGDEDVGTESADYAHDIGEDGAAVPDPERLVRMLGEAEVIRAREELDGPIDPPRGDQFLRTNHPETIAQVGTDEILTSVAAGEGEIARAIAATEGQRGEQAGVLIVGMGGDVQDATQLAERVQLLENPPGRERLGPRCVDGCAGHRRRGEKEGGEAEGEGAERDHGE